jgi:hypothetical protein
VTAPDESRIAEGRDILIEEWQNLRRLAVLREMLDEPSIRKRMDFTPRAEPEDEVR